MLCCGFEFSIPVILKVLEPRKRSTPLQDADQFLTWVHPTTGHRTAPRLWEHPITEYRPAPCLWEHPTTVYKAAFFLWLF